MHFGDRCWGRGPREENVSVWQLIITVVCSKILTWKAWFDFTQAGIKQTLTPEKTTTCPRYDCIMRALTRLIGIFCGEVKPAKSGFLVDLQTLLPPLSHWSQLLSKCHSTFFLLLKKHIEASLRPCLCWWDSHKDVSISLPTTPEAEDGSEMTSPSLWALTDLSLSSYAILPSNLLDAGQLIQKLLGTTRDRRAAQSQKLCSLITQSYRLEAFSSPLGRRRWRRNKRETYVQNALDI